MPQISESVARQAEAIQVELNRAVSAAKSNGDLSPEGKTRQMATAFVTAERKMAGLKDSWESTASKTATTTSRDVFGAVSTAGADAISARDAADRAAQLSDPAEASQLLAWAEENGDQVLARAIAQRSYTESRSGIFGSGWGEVIGTYAESHPDVGQKLDALEAASNDSLQTNIQAAFVFALPKPTELSRLTPGEMQRLAGSL